MNIDNPAALHFIMQDDIFLLKKEESFSIRQIAEQLNISEQTVKNQLQSAYQRLKLRLRDYDAPFAATGLLVISLLSIHNV